MSGGIIISLVSSLHISHRLERLLDFAVIEP